MQSGAMYSDQDHQMQMMNAQTVPIVTNLNTDSRMGSAENL